MFMSLGPQMADNIVNLPKGGLIFNTGPYGDPHLKNQNFENWALSCFKLAEIRPTAKKNYESGTFAGFGKCRQSFIKYPADF